MVEPLAAFTTAAREYDLIGLADRLEVLHLCGTKRKTKSIKTILEASHKIQKRLDKFSGEKDHTKI